MSIRPFLKSRWRWMLAGCVVLFLGILIACLPVRDWVKALAAFAEKSGVWGVVLFIAANGVAAVLLIPGWVFTVTAGLMYGVGRGCLVAHAGSTLGAALAFLCGRHLIRDRVERLLKNNQKFYAVDQAIGRQGWKIVSLIRLSPAIPFFLQNYLFSVTSIRFWPYVLCTAVFTFPGTLFNVYLGAAGRYGVLGMKSESGPMEWVLLGVGFVATVVGAFYVSRVAKKALAEAGTLK
ncbi:MAG: TVP38/TMEM64 family protein [Prosthecobacter sp.]|nr:TVP38/TMEM64 family protein [Prosthecobacter sp.]